MEKTTTSKKKEESEVSIVLAVSELGVIGKERFYALKKFRKEQPRTLSLWKKFFKSENII